MQCHLNHGGWCHLLECNWLIFIVHFGPFEAHFWPQILSNEYRGAVNACIQAVWLQGILSEFDLGSTLSTILFCDNQSAIKISTDPVTRQRTKHVDIHMHYIRELVHDRTIILQYCPTDEQIADIFTKSFSEKKFTYLRSLLGVSSSGWSRLLSVFSLRGGFFPLGFPSFPHLVCFEHCFSCFIVQGDLWPLFPGP